MKQYILIKDTVIERKNLERGDKEFPLYIKHKESAGAFIFGVKEDTVYKLIPEETHRIFGAMYRELTPTGRVKKNGNKMTLHYAELVEDLRHPYGLEESEGPTK